jgi:hypothetical protein
MFNAHEFLMNYLRRPDSNPSHFPPFHSLFFKPFFIFVTWSTKDQNLPYEEDTYFNDGCFPGFLHKWLFNG